MTTKNISLTLLSDMDLISGTKETTRVIEAIIEAPVLNRKIKRPSLNLAIVLDRSGSMAGEKLAFVKQAALHLIDLLDAQDRVALVIYDHSVEVLTPVMEMSQANRNTLKASLNKVTSGGNTFLSGGWIAGCQELARSTQEKAINRVLLLTDGLANEGITDLEKLATEAGEFYARGISTSTFGVGSGFNEHLLEAMSNQGGGNFHFIESPMSIPHIFEKEFAELIDVTVRDVELNLAIPTGIKAVVPGGWRTEREKEILRIHLGNMVSGRKQPVYISLTIPESKDEKLSIHCTVRGKDLKDSVIDAQGDITFKYSSDQEIKKATVNEDLLERHAAIVMADAATESLRLEREGKRQEALNHLYSKTNENRPFLKNRAQDYDSLHRMMSNGMDPIDLKRMHYREYTRKKVLSSVGEYRLHQPGGHIVINVDGQAVLVDTGSPISLGYKGSFRLLGRDYPLMPSFQNVVDMEGLSNKIGIHLDVLMGTDILRNCYFVIDTIRMITIFSYEPHEWNIDHRIPMADCLMGVMTVEALIKNKSVKLFVDTGAVRSYLPEELTQGCERIGEAHDFYPGLDDFTTPLYRVPVELAGKSVELECGVALPVLLQSGMDAIGVRGILGMDLARRNILGFAMPEKELMFVYG